MTVAVVIAFLAVLAPLLALLWKFRDRKVTVLAYDGGEPIRTYAFVSPKDRIVPRALSAWVQPLANEGITWCWGWKQEDVDALVVANVLR